MKAEQRANLSLFAAFAAVLVSIGSCLSNQYNRVVDRKLANARFISRGTEGPQGDVTTVTVFNDGLEQAAVSHISFTVEHQKTTPPRQMSANTINAIPVVFRASDSNENGYSREFSPAIKIAGKEHVALQLRIIDEDRAGTTFVGVLTVHYDGGEEFDIHNVMLDASREAPQAVPYYHAPWGPNPWNQQPPSGEESPSTEKEKSPGPPQPPVPAD